MEKQHVVPDSHYFFSPMKEKVKILCKIAKEENVELYPNFPELKNVKLSLSTEDIWKEVFSYTGHENELISGIVLPLRKLVIEDNFKNHDLRKEFLQKLWKRFPKNTCHEEYDAIMIYYNNALRKSSITGTLNMYRQLKEDLCVDIPLHKEEEWKTLDAFSQKILHHFGVDKIQDFTNRKYDELNIIQKLTVCHENLDFCRVIIETVTKMHKMPIE